MTLSEIARTEIDTATDPLIRVENLQVRFGTSDAPVVDGVSFSLHRGEILAIVGESGSGKSVTTRSLVGLAGPGARVRADRFDILGESALHRTERQWRTVRGRRIGLVLQDALTALDPLRTIGQEITESLERSVPRAHRDRTVEDILASVGIADPAVTRRQRSFQLSGGQRQRALIASALAGDPQILVADEPTTALDVTVQAQVLDLLVEQVRGGRAMILVSHDLAVVSAVADRVIVMQAGRVVEQGPVRRVIDHPAAGYTRELLAAVPRGTARRTSPADPSAVLVADGLTKNYRVLGSAVTAVDDVSFRVHSGEVLGVVGESGSGKSTVAKMVTGLITPDAGTMTFDGAPLTAGTRRPGRIALVAQDSVASFDPRFRVGEIIAEAVATVTPEPDRAERVAQLLDAVHLGADTVHRHPRDLSGGQRQRVNIARALGSQPRLVVCDEPVSALDITVQAQILDLLAELAENTDAAFLFISHDLAVVRRLCHNLVVLDQGRIVEHGSTDTVFDAPASPYTRRLLDAIPTLGTPHLEKDEPVA
ncbi:MAG: ABC transporter ATP-binding protein [Rhodococcus sp. (in: high G+C Gram-positive bacteria)]